MRLVLIGVALLLVGCEGWAHPRLIEDESGDGGEDVKKEAHRASLLPIP